MKPKSNLRHFLSLAGSSLLVVSHTHAATVNWQGDTSNLWATAGNWDTAPANSLNTDIVNFNLATYGGNPVFAPTVGTATSINGITIGASNGTMTLTNTAALSIGNSGINIANGAGAFTISGSTTLGAAQSWTNNSANLFTFGAVTNGANLLTIGGSGNTTASGIIGNGAGGLTKEGAGILTLNAANTYTGATTVNGGELRWGVANAIAAGALNINNGGTVNIQTFTDTVGTITLAKGGSITGSTGTLSTDSGGFISNDGGTISGFSALAGLRLSGGLTYNSTGPGSTTLQIDRVYVNDLPTTVFNIADGAAAVDFDITQQLVTNSSNNSGRTIRKTGAGVMQLSGSEANYTTQNYMHLDIWEGTVILNKTAGVNATGNGGTITIGDGAGAAGSAILKFNADNQVTLAGGNAITINSDGLFDLNGKTQSIGGAWTLNSTGQLQLNNGSLTVGSLNLNPSTGNTTSLSLGASGTLTLGGDVTLNAAGTGRAQITGSTLSLGAANRIFNIGLGSGANYDLFVGAGITGARSLTKNGLGRLVLTGSNDYTLGTIVNAGTLQIGDGTTAGTMTSTGALTVGGGTFAVLAPTSGSSSQTVASLATTASTNSIIRITPGSSGNTTLTITSGTLSTGGGSSVNFNYTAGTTVGGTVGNNYVVWSPTLTAGIIGGAYSVTDSAGTGFATRNGANVVRLTDPGGAGLPLSTGSATGSYFIGSGYSTVSTTTPGSLVQALSGAVAASNVTVDTTGLSSGANLALGTNVLTLGAGMAFNGANPYQITGSGAGGLRAATSGGTLYLNNGNTSTVTINAPILANGAGGLTVNGTGTTILGGVNTYTGTTFLNGGTLGVANQLAVQNSTLTMGGGTAALVFDSSVAGNAFTFGGLAASTSGTGYDIVLQNNAAIPAAVSLTVGGNNATTTFAGNLIGGGSLTKVGTGALTLSGTNTYSGGTVLNGGALSVNSDAALGTAGTGITVSGSTTLNSLATVSTEYNRAISLDAGTLTLTHAGGNTANFSGAITGSGNLTATLGTSGSTIALTNTGNTFTGNVLATVSGNGNVKLSFNSIGDGGMLSLGKNSYTVYMQYTGSSDLVLNTRRIDLNSSFSSVNDGGGNPINMFESNGTGAIRFNAGMTVAAGKTGTFFFGGTNTGDNTYAGVIPNSSGGTLSIGKHGAGKWTLSNDNTFAGGVEVRGGTLVLSGTNTYTGATTISGGTLVVSTIANYGDNSSIGKGTLGTSIAMGSNSALVYTGTAISNTDRQIDFTPSGTSAANSPSILNNGTGALNFTASTFNTGTATNNNRGLIIGGTNGGTISGAMVYTGANTSQGFWSLAKNGSGTWTLAGSNTNSGQTSLNAGTLRLDYTTNNNSKLSEVATVGFLLLNGGTLELNGGSHAEAVVSTTLNNGTSFIKRSSGSSTLLTGAITYTGGALDFSAAGIANVSTSTVTNGILSSAAGTARVTVGGADWAAKDVSNNVIAYTGYTSFTGGATSANTNYSSVGDVTLGANRGAASNTFKITTSGSGQSMKLNSNFNLTLGSLLFAGADNYSIAAESGTGRIDSAFLLHNYGAGTLTLGATNGAITQFGTGTTILSGNNAADVGINIFGGTVQFSNNLQIGTNATAKAIALNNGTLRANTGGGDIALNSSGTLSRTVTLGAGGGTLDVIGGNKLTVSGVISDTAGQFPTLTIGSGSTDGTIELTGTNTYTGRTFISGGTLSVGTIGNGGVAGNLGQASSLAYNIVFDGGTLLYTGANATSDRAFTISAGKTAIINTTNNLSLVGATGPATNGALTKTGAGTLTLTGTNTYTGGTTVSAGMLAIGTGGSINSSSGITIGSGGHFKYNSSTALTAPVTNNGGTISGTGTIGVAVNLNSTSDIIAPGNSPGIQPYGTSQTWSSFTYQWETNNFTGTTAGTDFDQVQITGGLDLTGAVAGSYILDLISLTALNAAGDVPNFSEVNRSWDILTATGGITGFNAGYWTIDHSTGLNTFTSSPTWGGTWSLSLNDTAGTDSLVLTYTAVPEPGAALLGGLGMLVLLRRRRSA